MGYKVRQCSIPDYMEKRFSYFFEKYSLKKYDNKKQPSLFFSGWDMGKAKRHRGIGVMIWRGSDATDDRILKLKKKKNIFHISISSFISDDLRRNGVKFKFIPVVGVDVSKFKVCPLGDEIYTYVPSHKTDKYYHRYGMKTVLNLQKRIKYKINIIDSPNMYTRKKIRDIYSRCFCSFRFTEHDGLPSQVIEMGVMGRRSFYNGDIPGSIKWDKNVDKIVENIELEAARIGTLDTEYSDEIKKFIDIGTDWLKIKHWR